MNDFVNMNETHHIFLPGMYGTAGVSRKADRVILGMLRHMSGFGDNGDRWLTIPFFGDKTTKGLGHLHSHSFHLGNKWRREAPSITGAPPSLVSEAVMFFHSSSSWNARRALELSLMPGQ